MRWPDIFFKSRKPKPAPKIVPVAPAAQTEAEKKKEKEDSRQAEEKAASLRALIESGNAQPNPRVAKESATASRAIDERAANAETTRISVASTATGAGASAASLRSGGVSLRQRAKLIEESLSLPKSTDVPSKTEEKSAPADSEKKSAEPAAPEGKPVPAAVVPPAFSVAVETGSVLEKSTEKKNGVFTATAASSAETKDSGIETPPAAKPSEIKKPETSTPSQEVPRVQPGNTPPASSSTAVDQAKPHADSREKQEFLLANGERIFGHVLSETPQTIYLDHGTLGVLTLPRSQIAQKPVEVILINGDRIVGDLVAETPECMYIKHASLGMLTVPHSQRSTRVVEAIMKDGDRILGEVLAETENFTVIRSATLGTVAVQHAQVAMLNRKIEQMQLRALPPSASAPTLEDKPKP